MPRPRNYCILEYARISECESTKEIWNALQIAYKGTNQVKQSRIELLVRKYELFKIDNKETVTFQ